MTNDKKTKVTSKLYGVAVVLMLASLLFLSFGLSGCKATIDYSETINDNQFSATYQLLNGTRSATIEVNDNTALLISYNSIVASGELTIRLYDSNHVLVYDFPAGTPGIKTFMVTSKEKYLLEVNGNDTRGSFNLQWLTN